MEAGQIGWVLRNCFNLKAKKLKGENKYGALTVVELLRAEKMLCKEIQKREFSEEYAQLENKDVVSNKRKLQQLSPYLDEEGLIRTVGCIKYAAILDTMKHQIIFPRKRSLVQQIIKHYHNKSHNGSEYIFSELRHVYWILNSTTAINSKTVSSLIYIYGRPTKCSVRL